MKKSAKLLAMFTTLSMLVCCTTPMANAAADPTENTLISIYSSKLGQHGGTYPAREIVSYDGRDSVVHYNYVKGTQTADMIYFTNDQANTSPNKKLSFEFLLHNTTIPYEVRLITTGNKMIGEFQLNFYGSATTIPDGTTQSRFGASQKAGVSLVNGRTINVTNDEWHTCEAIMDETGTSFYVDGAYVDRTVITDFVSEDGLTAVQIVQRATNQSTTVGTEDGVYFDNIKTYFYDENSQFYGVASYDGEYGITVDFSESISSTYSGDFSDVELINTKTGESIGLENVIKNSQTQIVVNSFYELGSGVEYMVKLPEDLKGISGKYIYSDVYFAVTDSIDLNSVQLDDDFESYSVASSALAGNIVSCAPEQFTSSYVNFVDVGGDHGNVLNVNRKIANNNRVRFGITGDSAVDVSLGTATIEFDIRVLDNAGFKYFTIQPYSIPTDGTSKTELTRAQWKQSDGAALGASANRVMDNYNTQMCNMFILTPSNLSGTTQEGNVIIQARYKVDNGLVIDNRAVQISPPAAGNNINMNVGNDWHHIKLTINHEGSTPITTYTLDDGTTYTSTVAGTGTYGKDATDLLCGVRFCEIPVDQDEDYNSPMVQFDNFKITGPNVPSACVKKIRMYNPDGEEFGPLSKEISPCANTAKVFFTDSVDVSDANIIVSNGSNIVDTQIGEYDSTEKSVSLILNETLLKNTKYTISITGVKTASGETVNETSADFTTINTGEFLIDGLSFIDENGDVITNTLGLQDNDTVYVSVKFINTLDTDREAVVIGSVYNANEMENFNYKKYTIAANSKTEIINEIPICISSVDDMCMAAMIFEGFDSAKALCDAVVLTK